MSIVDIAVRDMLEKSLVYAFIPNYRCIKDVNLCFNPKLSIRYNPETKILSMRQNDTFPSDFWPKNIYSVAAIVGKNGAGKSSALRWILERLTIGYPVETLNGIIIIKEGNVLKVYHDIEISLDTDIRAYNVEMFDTLTLDKTELRTAISLPSVYDAGHFDTYQGDSPVFKDLDGVRNISDKWLLIHDLESYRNIDDNTLNRSMAEHYFAYNIQNDLRICSLLLNPYFQNTFSKNGTPTIRLPKYIIFRPNTSGDQNIRDRIEFLRATLEKNNGSVSDKAKEHQYDFLRRISKIPYNTEIENKEKERERGLLSRFLYCSLLNFYFSISKMDFLPVQALDWLAGFYTDEYLNENQGVINYLNRVQNKINRESRSKASINPHWAKAVDFASEFICNLIRFIDFLDGEVQWRNHIPHLECTRIIYDHDVVIPLEPIQIYATSFPNYKTHKGKKLLEMIRSSSFVTERFFDLKYAHSLRVDSTLSSGELGFLNLYSRLNEVYSTLMPGDSSHPVLILLDEVEISFHPEWQRKFIANITSFLSLLTEQFPPIQIIYSTHSPITLSDMPIEGVNLLETSDGFTHDSDKNFKSFGANIFDLYSHQFFMDNLIGEFASRKIKQLNEEITEFKISEDDSKDSIMTRYNVLLNKINMIGDERVKQYLTRLLEEKYPLFAIQRLEKRIAELRNKYKSDK